MTDPQPTPDNNTAEPANTSETADPAGTAEPAEANEAAEPAAVAEPAEHAGAAEPEGSESAESAEPRETADAAGWAGGAAATVTVEGAEPLEMSTSVEAAEPAELAPTAAEPAAVVPAIAEPATLADPAFVAATPPVPTAVDATGIPGVAPTAAPPPAAPTVQPGAIGAAAVPPGPVGPTVGDQAAELTLKTVAVLTTTTRTILAGLDPTGIRPTLIVAGILVALVLGTQLLNGFIPAPGPRSGPNVGPIVAGSRVQVTDNVSFLIVSGWQPGTRFTDDLPGVLLQKGNVFVEARATRTAVGGTLPDFMSRLVRIVGGQLSGFQPTPAQTVALGNGLNGLRVDYAGTNRNGAAQQGQITVFLTSTGTGILMHAFGQQGAVQPLLGEVQTMISTLEVR